MIQRKNIDDVPSPGDIPLVFDECPRDIAEPGQALDQRIARANRPGLDFDPGFPFGQIGFDPDAEGGQRGDDDQRIPAANGPQQPDLAFDARQIRQVVDIGILEREKMGLDRIVADPEKFQPLPQFLHLLVDVFVFADHPDDILLFQGEYGRDHELFAIPADQSHFDSRLNGVDQAPEFGAERFIHHRTIIACNPPGRIEFPI